LHCDETGSGSGRELGRARASLWGLIVGLWLMVAVLEMRGPASCSRLVEGAAAGRGTELVQVSGQVGGQAELPCLIGRQSVCGEPYLIAWYRLNGSSRAWHRIEHHSEEEQWPPQWPGASLNERARFLWDRTQRSGAASQWAQVSPAAALHTPLQLQFQSPASSSSSLASSLTLRADPKVWQQQRTLSGGTQSGSGGGNNSYANNNNNNNNNGAKAAPHWPLSSSNCPPALLQQLQQSQRSPNALQTGHFECAQLALRPLELLDEGQYKCEITFSESVDYEHCPVATVSQLNVIGKCAPRWFSPSGAFSLSRLRPLCWAAGLLDAPTLTRAPS